MIQWKFHGFSFFLKSPKSNFPGPPPNVSKTLTNLAQKDRFYTYVHTYNYCTTTDMASVLFKIYFFPKHDENTVTVCIIIIPPRIFIISP